MGRVVAGPALEANIESQRAHSGNECVNGVAFVQAGSHS